MNSTTLPPEEELIVNQQSQNTNVDDQALMEVLDEQLGKGVVPNCFTYLDRVL